VIAQHAASVIESTLRQVLAADLRVLAAGRPFPINLRRLVADLGLELKRRKASRGAPHGELLVVGDRWQIAVNSATHMTRQRFTIAHEIGHYVIEARMGFRPRSSREYWMLEEVCQHFAAELLSPRALVQEALTPLPSTPGEVFEVMDRLIRATDLSLEAAARRIVDTIDRPLALGALRVHDVEGTSGRRQSVLWVHSNSPWLRPGRGEQIRKDHALREASQRAQDLALSARAIVALPNTSVASIHRRGLSLALFSAFLTARGELAEVAA
jgi:hypothetical protein